jgi:hypothetical protein
LQPNAEDKESRECRKNCGEYVVNFGDVLEEEHQDEDRVGAKDLARNRHGSAPVFWAGIAKPFAVTVHQYAGSKMGDHHRADPILCLLQRRRDKKDQAKKYVKNNLSPDHHEI